MLKNLFHSLAILLIIFGFMWVFSQIPVFQNLEVFNPVSKALDDFDMTDVVFSKLRPALPADERITLVNIGELDRTGIAELLNIIAQHQPRVVGIDAFFRSPKDPQTDSTLLASLAQFKNLVLVNELSSNKFNEKTKQYDSLETSHPLFLEKARGGYANLSTEGVGNETGFYTCRSFIPAIQVKGQGEVKAFGVKLAELYDPVAAKDFLARKNPSEYINYRGNIGIESGQPAVFRALDFSQVFEQQFEAEEVFKDRIVILGYLGRSLGQRSFDDKFYTPLNENYVDKRTPDMFGVVIHANIVSMILNREYIEELNGWIDFSISVFITLLSIMLFSYFFQKLGYWYDAVTILFQVFFFLGILLIGLYAFVWYRLRVEINLAILAVAFAGIFVEIYYGLILKIFNFKKRTS
ncbi:MAG: hypothetical protein OHK0053_04140 [Microscillaceae bacterium]